METILSKSALAQARYCGWWPSISNRAETLSLETLAPTRVPLLVRQPSAKVAQTPPASSAL